jgi:predicted carbohydrate-binding protein with CBM5 and CBM33 domain
MRMSIRMNVLAKPLIYRPLFVLAAAAVMLTTVLVATAEAHGSTIDAPSRNFGCWQRWASNFQDPAMQTADPMCWQAWQADPNAMWNWNGLYQEGFAGDYQGHIPDGQLCSGGHSTAGRYNSMDTVGNWMASNISNNFTWKMHDQARHGATYIRIYVTKQGFNPLTQPLGWGNLELLKDTGPIPASAGTVETDPVLNGVTYSVPISAPGRTGRHMVFAIWLAAHADQAYFLCSDVNFGGTTPTTAPPTTTPPTSAPATTRPPTTPVVTTRPPTTAPATSAPAGTRACSATYTQTNQWPGGFQGDVQVTAGSVAITGWTVTLTFPNGQTLTQVWNASVTTSGSTVTARNVTWNGGIPAAASNTFGFLGSWTGSNGAPTLACTAT